MKNKFKKGDRVHVCVDGDVSTYYGEGKVVIAHDGTEYMPVGVEFNNIDGEKYDGTIYFSEDELELVKAKKAKRKPKQTYLGNGKHEWELVVKGDYRVIGKSYAHRLRVPGGWLYNVNNDDTVFVPLVEVTGHVI